MKTKSIAAIPHYLEKKADKNRSAVNDDYFEGHSDGYDKATKRASEQVAKACCRLKGIKDRLSERVYLLSRNHLIEDNDSLFSILEDLQEELMPNGKP